MKNLWKVTLWAIALLSSLLVLWGCGEAKPETPDEGMHTCAGVSWVTEKEATCTAEDSKKFVCSCGKTVKTEKIPLLSHTEVTVPGRASTCTQKGLTDGKKCSVCNATLVAQTETPLGDHTEEIVPGKASTCTEKGLTDGKKCSVCGEMLVEQTEIPLRDHNMADGVCTECYYPYIPIRTVTDLQNVSANLSGNYILMNDLDLGDMEWTPIGNEDNPFTGTFDGNGHVIENFKITGEMQYVGLFGNSKGTIKNLGLESFTIDVNCSGYICAGGLVGGNYGTITNSYATGDVSASSTDDTCVGGLVGGNVDGTITNCYATGDVSASRTGSSDNVYAGGLVGGNYGTITNSYATGDVSASSTGYYVSAGGLVGENDGGTITNCYATGDVSASSNFYAYAGGLVGDNYSGSITNCYATGDVSASNTSTSSTDYAYAGGLVGYSRNATITNCYRYSGQSFTVTQNGTTTYEATNTVGIATSIENLQSKEWVEENLWKVETEIWSFGSGYLTLDYDVIETPVEISTKEDLLKLQDEWIVRKYKLMADIDLGGMEWQPIAMFLGTFDGNGHVISNFKITSEVQYAGLFGRNYGTIQNLGLESFTIDVNCSGDVYAGGLVGVNSVTVTNCYATGDVSASSTSTSYSAYVSAGGLVGRNSGTITNNYATGNVSATASGADCSEVSAGGLVGYNYGYNGYATITNCYAMGDVSASSTTSYSDASAGGLVGYNYYGTITNCYATGDVSASSTSTIHSAYASAGGLVGGNSYGAITNCYATVDVSASSTSTSYSAYAYAGGLVGYNDDGTITNCYATGGVSASSTSSDAYAYAGGLVGETMGTITNCYRYSGQSFTVTQNGVTAYEATNTVGTATDMPTLQSVDFQQNTLLWSAEDWNFAAGAHPTLKNVGTAN